MASSVSRYVPKQIPTDVWSLREKLALACAVKRSGDNNWVSVSRAIRPYGEPNRPSDWFSQKNCALQYSDLLEKVETPKRKRGERETSSVESPGEVIIRKLTIERIEELKRVVQEEEQRYKRLKRDVEEVLSGQADDRLDDMQLEIEREKKAALEAEKKWSEELAAREQAKQRNRKVAPGLKVKIEPEESPQESPADTVSLAEEDSNQSQVTETALKPTPAQDIKSPSLTGETPGNVVKGVEVKQEEETATRTDIKEEPVEVDISAVTRNDEHQDVDSTNEAKPTRDEKPEETGKSEQNTAATVDSAEVALNEPAEISVKETKADKTKDPRAESGGAKRSSISDRQSEGEKKGAKVEHDNIVKSKAPEQDLVKDNKDSLKNLSEDVSEDSSSTVDTSAVTKEVKQDSADKEKDVFIQVDDSKQVKDPEPVTEPINVAPVKDFEESQLSPASSVMSNDTDGGTVYGRGRGRRRHGGKHKGGRRSLRTTRGRSIMEEEKAKESETSSKAESTDDDGGDITLHESDDTTPNITGRHHQLSFTDSVPNSPASVTPGDTEDEKAFKLWKKSIMLVWRAAANHKYANVFSHPVTEEIAPGYHSVVFRYTNVFSHPVKEEIAPGYHSIVHRPLDLATIKKNIESGVIRTTVEFQRDMMQMFTNAIMYNNSDHDVCHMATEMYDDVMKHIEQYVHTQMLVQGGDAKLLRASRRSEAHSDKEDDPKRKTLEQDGGKAKKRKF